MFNIQPQNPQNSKLGGLLIYKPQWTLSFCGWSLIALLFVLVMLLIFTQIHPFLAVSAPIKADALVVEGWMNDQVIKEAITEFEQGDYQVLITTGLPIGKGFYLSDYKNFADLSAATLITLGFDANKIVTIPTPSVKINRTTASAMAVRDWLNSSSLSIQSLNIYSLDVHTRRSWLIFKQVLMPKFKVGAIAYSSPGYNTQYWWTSSEGFRSVLSEAFAYFYARFIAWMVQR